MKFFKYLILGSILFQIANASDDIGTVMAVYDNKIPKEIIVNEKYKGGHPDILDYVFTRARVSNLRDKPSISGKIIKKYPYDTKLITLKKIFNEGNVWFEVKDTNDNTGYISASLVVKRNFRFQMALDKIHQLENFINKEMEKGNLLASTNSYIPNPNNVDFKREKDKYGTTLDQASIAKSVKTGEYIYVPDRSILSILENDGNESRIKVANIPEELIIDNSSLSFNPKISKEFKKVIAIDTKNQNMMIFEKNENNWEVISYVYSKTGIESTLGFETPKGFFISPMAKYLMPYNGEEGEKQGYARFAIRFSGGGYLHGTPINFDEEINKEFFMKQKEKTLGTFTGTRKCIRTSEEHAEFIFDWIVDSPIKNSNYQKPSENVMFVIF